MAWCSVKAQGQLYPYDFKPSNWPRFIRLPLFALCNPFHGDRIPRLCLYISAPKLLNEFLLVLVLGVCTESYEIDLISIRM
jgi:hypothetical protein